MTTPIALTIAGSDSSGGAGIQADLKTFAALGVYGASVITALTAQNTHGRQRHSPGAGRVRDRADRRGVFRSRCRRRQDRHGGAARDIDAIAAGLTRWSPKHVVLDPVMVATSGDRLLAAEAVDALRTKLIPRASLITPNLPEAAALLDEPVAASEAAVENQGKRLLAMGCRAVLIKGGHGQGAESIDYLVDCKRRHRAGRAAHRHQKYPRHRLLVVIGDRRRACEGRGHGNRRAQRQGLDQRGDCGGRPFQRRPRPRPDPSFSPVLLNLSVRRPANAGLIPPVRREEPSTLDVPDCRTHGCYSRRVRVACCRIALLSASRGMH